MYKTTVERIVGIVKIDDELHQELRLASQVMSRSINAQAEFWIKMGRLAELNPQANYQQLLHEQLQANNRKVPELGLEAQHAS